MFVNVAHVAAVIVFGVYSAAKVCVDIPKNAIMKIVNCRRNAKLKREQNKFMAKWYALKEEELREKERNRK